jgi:hypothetical protein
MHEQLLILLVASMAVRHLTRAGSLIISGATIRWSHALLKAN